MVPDGTTNHPEAATTDAPAPSRCHPPRPAPPLLPKLSRPTTDLARPRPPNPSRACAAPCPRLGPIHLLQSPHRWARRPPASPPDLTPRHRIRRRRCYRCPRPSLLRLLSRPPPAHPTHTARSAAAAPRPMRLASAPLSPAYDAPRRFVVMPLCGRSISLALDRNQRMPRVRGSTKYYGGWWNFIYSWRGTMTQEGRGTFQPARNGRYRSAMTVYLGLLK